MPDELAEGFYFGKYQLDSYFENLTETAFALFEGETSDLIHSGDGVYVVRRLPKDEAYIDNAENLELLREYYLLDNFYRVISEKSEETLLTLKSEKAYERVTLDSVKMGK
jgi:parvulin-like peptidyl-prolyl isomerase